MEYPFFLIPFCRQVRSGMLHRHSGLYLYLMPFPKNQGKGQSNLPLAYDHFAEGESPDPPFLIFLFPGTDNMFADNKVWQKINQLNIELYTDEKSPETEETIEDILDSYEIPYEKSEYWIESEMMYEVLYQTEILGGN